MEAEIKSLVKEIENAESTEFWWDSPLLARAAGVQDPRLVRALTIRHHSLSNKDAFSAHVLRQTIKLAAGPKLTFLWECIDEESDSSAIVARMDDLDYLPWAAAFVLGEIGGAVAFSAAVQRLSPAHSARHYLIVRLLSHVTVRYLKIREATEPRVTYIDLKTGESEKLLSRYVSRPNFDMESRKRVEANEYFTPLPRAIINDAVAALEPIQDNLFNYPKLDFLQALAVLRGRSSI